VMHDDDAVTRQVDVELQPVRPEREAVIEREQRVLGPELRAAAVRVDEGHGVSLVVQALRFKGSGFKGSRFGFTVQGSGFRFTVQGSGSRFRVLRQPTP